MFDFEVDISRHTKCTVHVFDCTTRSPSTPGNIQYHDWCLGGENRREKGALARLRGTVDVQIRTLQTTIDWLNASRIDVLKIDIEGSEWEFLRNHIVSCLTSSCLLPEQIVVEIHFENSVASVDAIASLSYDLHCLGYLVLAVRPNYNCAGCAEVSLARLFA